MTVLCRQGPPVGGAALRDPVPEAEMMSTGGGTDVRRELLYVAWEGQARGPCWPGGGHLRVLGPWTWVASLLLPLFQGLKNPAVSSISLRPLPRRAVDPLGSQPGSLGGCWRCTAFMSFGGLLGPVTFLN